MAERLPRVLLLLLGVRAAGLHQRRGGADRTERRRQLLPEGTDRPVRCRRLPGQAAGLLRRPVHRLGEVAAIPGGWTRRSTRHEEMSASAGAHDSRALAREYMAASHPRAADLHLLSGGTAAHLFVV